MILWSKYRYSFAVNVLKGHFTGIFHLLSVNMFHILWSKQNYYSLELWWTFQKHLFLLSPGWHWAHLEDRWFFSGCLWVASWFSDWRLFIEQQFIINVRKMILPLIAVNGGVPPLPKNQRSSRRAQCHPGVDKRNRCFWNIQHTQVSSNFVSIREYETYLLIFIYRSWWTYSTIFHLLLCNIVDM